MAAKRNAHTLSAAGNAGNAESVCALPLLSRTPLLRTSMPKVASALASLSPAVPDQRAAADPRPRVLLVDRPQALQHPHRGAQQVRVALNTDAQG